MKSICFLFGILCHLAGLILQQDIKYSAFSGFKKLQPNKKTLKIPKTWSFCVLQVEGEISSMLAYVVK